MLSGYDDLQSAMIIEALELPELVFPITTVTVGWPAEEPAQVDRLPLEAIVHEETYHDYTPEDIDRLYAYKESLPENKQFIFENNKETLAQVFTDVRYKKEDNEVMSENLWKVIKKAGFLTLLFNDAWISSISARKVLSTSRNSLMVLQACNTVA